MRCVFSLSGPVFRTAVTMAALALELATTSVPGARAAEPKWGDGGWYVGLAVPVMFIDESASTTTGAQAVNPQALAERQPYTAKPMSEYETGFKVAGTVGYELAEGFRVEGELFFARADVAKVSYKGVPAAGVIDVPISGTADHLGAFANVWYDFDTGSDWIPYIGGGLGFTRVDQSKLKYDSQKLFRDSYAAGLRANGQSDHQIQQALAALPDVPEISTTDTVFAYHVGLGIGYRLTDNTVLQAGYRLQAASDLEFEGSNAAGTAKVTSGLRVHLLEIGFRYRF